MLRQQILALLVLSFLVFQATPSLNFWKVEKDVHSFSWLPSSTLSLASPSLDVNKWQSATPSNTDYEVRRIESLLPSENDLNFFDRLFNNNKLRSGPTELFNRTIVNYRFSDRKNITYTLCHLATFLDFQTNVISSDISVNALRELGAVLMAAWDVNTGNNSVIPQTKQCNGKMNLRFTTEFFDGAHEPLRTAKELTTILERRHSLAGAAEDNNVVKAYPVGNIGSLRSSIADLLSTLAGVNDLVTISHAASAIELASSEKFPLFGRTIPSTLGDAMAVVSFFSEFLNATHVGLLHINDKYGNSYRLSLRTAANRMQSPIRFTSVSLPVKLSEEDALKAILRLKETGIRYIVGILFEEDLQRIMPLAYERGIAGENYFWMFTESVLSLANSPTSDIAQALHGSAILGPAIGKALLQGSQFYDVYTSRFSALWESGEGWKYLQSKIPNVNLTRDILVGSEPSVYELFLYEAVVALCLASCSAAESNTSKFFTANELFESFAQTTFDGVYGPASFEKKTGDRSIDTVEYAVYNILAKGNTAVIEATYRRARNSKRGTSDILRWKSVRGRDFVYANGSTNPPQNLPPLEENKHFITTGTVSFCLGLSGLILLISVLAAVWTYKRRKTKVVCASQPFFLYMLCVGTFIMGTAIIPFSLLAFGLSESSWDISCMSGPWLFFPGFTVSFSALFSKTKRINKIMSMGRKMQRVVIKPRDVMKPFFFLMTVNLALLITWTIVAPLEYKRYIREISVDRYGRYIESYGACWRPYEESVVEDIIFIVLLTAVNLSAVILSCYHAYHSRSILTDYNESQYIGMTVFAVLEILIIGGLIFGISNDEPTVLFVAISLVVSGVCFAIILPMFWSKVVALQNERQRDKEKEEEKKKRLERLRVFDQMKMRQGVRALIPTTTVATTGPSNIANDVGSGPEEASSQADSQNKEYGVQIISTAEKADSCKTIRRQISITRVENDGLKKSICSMKSSIDSLISSTNR